MDQQLFPLFTGCMVIVLLGVIFCALYLWLPFYKRKRSSSHPVDTMITQLARWSFYSGVFSLSLNVGTVTQAEGWDWLLRGWSGGLIIAIAVSGVLGVFAHFASKSPQMNAWLYRQAQRWNELFRRKR